MITSIHMRYFFSFLSILLLFSSCTPAQQTNPTSLPDEQAVATIVAATMSALKVGSEPLATTGVKATATMHGLWPQVPTEAPATATQEIKPAEMENMPPAGYDTQVLRVVYFSGSELKLWTQGGSETLLYSGEPVDQISLSQDGWVIVFTTRDVEYLFTGLWRVNADGSDLQRLLAPGDLKAFQTDPEASGMSIYQMEFAPGKRDLFFNTRQIFMGPGINLLDDLQVVDTNNGKLQTLLEPGKGGIFYFSPGGEQLALVTRTGISLVNADGSKYRENVLSYPEVMTYSDYHYYPKLSWKADGESVWAVIPSEDSMAEDASMAVWQIPLISGVPALQGSYPAGLSLFFSGQVISPDLDKIAYLEREGKPEANQWNLHIAKLDGSVDSIVRTGNIRFKGWSPDGTWVTVEEEGIFLVGFAAGNFWQLAGNMPTIEMKWVDSERYLFLSGDYKAMELHLGRVRAPSQVIGPVSSDYMPFDFAPHFQIQSIEQNLNILGN